MTSDDAIDASPRPTASAATCARCSATIADRYDFITVAAVVRAGPAVEAAAVDLVRPRVRPGGRALDLATGTGDIAFALAAARMRDVSGSTSRCG